MVLERGLGHRHVLVQSLTDLKLGGTVGSGWRAHGHRPRFDRFACNLGSATTTTRTRARTAGNLAGTGKQTRTQAGRRITHDEARMETVTVVGSQQGECGYLLVSCI